MSDSGLPALSHTRQQLEAQGLPKLTGKRYRFVMMVVAGHTYSDAYRKAYKADMAEQTLWTEACRLAAHPKVSPWLDFYDQKRAEALVSGLSQDRIVADLIRSREQARQSGKFAAVMRANELIGKHLDMWAEGGGSAPDGLENATVADLQRMLKRLDKAQKALPVVGETVIDQ